MVDGVPAAIGVAVAQAVPEPKERPFWSTGSVQNSAVYDGE
jgi:hypothetical protein